MFYVVNNGFDNLNSRNGFSNKDKEHTKKRFQVVFKSLDAFIDNL